MKGRAAANQIQVILNSLAGAGVDIASRTDLASVVWDVATSGYKHVVITGATGAAGKQVEMQKTATHIQWRYVGDVSWINLVLLTDITGPAGPNTVQTGTTTNINGLLKGDGSAISRAVPGEDFVVPTDPRFSNLGTTTLTYSLELNETILKGKAVQLMPTGKIEGIKESTLALAFPAGTINNFYTNNGQSTTHHVKMDPRNSSRFMILKTVSGSMMYAAVGTINHTTNALTVGAFVYLENYYAYNGVAPVFDIDPFNADRFMVCYTHSNSSVGMCFHGSIANNTPSLLMTSAFYNNYNYSISMCYDKKNANRVLIGYTDYQYYPCAVACIISGSTFSFGAPLTLQSFQSEVKSIASNPLVDGSYLITYMRSSNVYMYVDHLSLSSSVVTRSTTMNLSSTSQTGQVVFSPFTKGEFLIFCTPTANSNYGTIMKGTLSDTFGVTFGAQYVFNSANMQNNATKKWMIHYDLVNKSNFTLAFQDTTVPNNIAFVRGTITGEVLSFGSKITVSTGYQSLFDDVPCSAIPIEGKLLYIYKLNETYAHCYVALAQFSVITSNIDKTKVLGILQKDGDITNVRDVLVQGIDETLTGLATGSVYYAQQNGAITATIAANSALLGIALSPTKLLIR